MSAIWICFFFFSMAFKSCWGCIPTPQHDDYLIPPDSFECEDSAGAYVETAVRLIDSGWGLAESRVCEMCPPAGRQLHFSSTNNAIPNQMSKEAAGTIDVPTCSDPCVCGSTQDSCYQARPGAVPHMTLYPYCDSAGCFLKIILTTPGEIYNIAYDTTISYTDQRDASGTLKPVTDATVFPRIRGVFCEECAAETQCPQKRGIEF